MLEAALLETLNAGSTEELLALHGIGPKRAEKILEVRTTVLRAHANEGCAFIHTRILYHFRCARPTARVPSAVCRTWSP